MDIGGEGVVECSYIYLYLQVFCADSIVYINSFESIRNIQACVQILVGSPQNTVPQRTGGNAKRTRYNFQVNMGLTHLAGAGRDDGRVQWLLLATDVQANLLKYIKL